MQQQNCLLFNKCNHKDCDKDFCLRRYKTEGLYKAALLPASQQDFVQLYADDDGTDSIQFAQLANLAQSMESFVRAGRNLYIHSKTCGNGKTSSAIKLMKAYIDKIWAKCSTGCHALFVSVPRFLIAIKNQIDSYDEYAEYVKAHVLEADLVIWDDIAAKTGTEFEVNHLLSLLDTRLSQKKSNIYTSNLGPNEITQALGNRISSRIYGLSLEIELHGKDKRYLAC